MPNETQKLIPPSFVELLHHHVMELLNLPEIDLQQQWYLAGSWLVFRYDCFCIEQSLSTGLTVSLGEIAAQLRLNCLEEFASQLAQRVVMELREQIHRLATNTGSSFKYSPFRFYRDLVHAVAETMKVELVDLRPTWNYDVQTQIVHIAFCDGQVDSQADMKLIRTLSNQDRQGDIAHRAEEISASLANLSLPEKNWRSATQALTLQFLLSSYQRLTEPFQPPQLPLAEWSQPRCSSCSYLMRGIKPGEPHICNAFHAISSLIEPIECLDYLTK